MAKHPKKVRDLLTEFALQHGVPSDKMIEAWSQRNQRKIVLDTPIIYYEERRDWWPEPELPRGHTLRVEAQGRTTYVIITVDDMHTDVVILPQSEVSRSLRDHQRLQSKNSVAKDLVRSKPAEPNTANPSASQIKELSSKTSPPKTQSPKKVNLGKVLDEFAEASGISPDAIRDMWREMYSKPVLSVPPPTKLTPEECLDLGLPYPTWHVLDYYLTFFEILLRGTHLNRTPRMIPARRVPKLGFVQHVATDKRRGSARSDGRHDQGDSLNLRDQHSPDES